MRNLKKKLTGILVIIGLAIGVLLSPFSYYLYVLGLAPQPAINGQTISLGKDWYVPFSHDVALIVSDKRHQIGNRVSYSKKTGVFSDDPLERITFFKIECSEISALDVGNFDEVEFPFGTVLVQKRSTTIGNLQAFYVNGCLEIMTNRMENFHSILTIKNSE